MTQFLECHLCDDYEIEVSEEDPDASLSEIDSHLRWDHNLKSTRSELAKIRLVTR